MVDKLVEALAGLLLLLVLACALERALAQVLPFLLLAGAVALAVWLWWRHRPEGHW